MAQKILTFLFLVTLMGAPKALATSNPTLQEGINAFQQGKFDDARQKFMELLKSPSWSFAALYNLGNTAVRQKHFGEALAFYSLALKRNPHDRDTQENIKFVYSQLGGRRLTAAPSNYELFQEHILDKLTFYEFLAATFILSILVLVQLNKYIKNRPQKNLDDPTDEPGSYRPPIPLLLSLVVFALFVTLSLLKLVDTYSGRGIVITNTVGLRSGPSETNATMMDVPEGSELIIHDVDHNWVQVNVRGGSLLGWVPQSSMIATSGEGP